MSVRSTATLIVGLALMLSSFARGVHAQEPDRLELNLLDQLNPFPGFDGQDGEDLSLSAEFQLAPGNREGRLSVIAKIGFGWHLYSVTQKPGGPMRSVIKIAPSNDFEVVGDFRPNRAPTIKEYEFFDVPVEEHDDEVIWTAPIRFKGSADPKELQIKIDFSGQVCQDSGVCLPKNDSLVATFAGMYEPVIATGEFRGPNDHVTIRGHVESASTSQGTTLTVTLTAELDPTWHIYAQAAQEGDGVSKPTLIVLELPTGWQLGEIESSDLPHEEETGDEFEPITRYHEGIVSWTTKVIVPSDATPGRVDLRGSMGYQVCTSTGCDTPQAVTFVAAVNIGEDPVRATPMAFTKASYGEVAKLAEQLSTVAAANTDDVVSTVGATLDLDNLEVSSWFQDLPLGLKMIFAFLAGLILNFMPCVLPVIGLKVMSFVQQAGDSRTRIFLLNFWFCLGMMAVFLVLATLAVTIGLNWGEQFRSVTFNIVLSAVIFVFALSFLGVWEIPIPGFVGAGKVNNLATKEGASGAFFKGVLTTVLATPCTGPILGSALSWAVSQPPVTTYAVFACVGLGMGSPFLLIGAFPKLVSFLPKPGAWMETFKNIMGFVLLGTVIFLLTFIEISYVVPTIAFLIGLWAAFWWIGRIPITATRDKKVAGWLAGGAFSLFICLAMFGGPFYPFRNHTLQAIMLSRFNTAVDRELTTRMDNQVKLAVSRAEEKKSEHELPWQPYTKALLVKYSSAKKTVFVDFTADW
jgi:thiol:disulfide interchange protein